MPPSSRSLIRSSSPTLLAAVIWSGLAAPAAWAQTASPDVGATIRAYPGASRGERAAVLGALTQDRSASLRALRAAAAQGDPEARVFAVQTLGAMRDPGAVDVLLAATADPNARIQKHAAASLRRLGDPAALPRLRALATPGQDRGVLKVALVGLGELGGSQDRARVRPFLTHPEPSVRVTAAGVLAMLGSEEGLAILLSGSESDDPLVRKNATFALGYSVTPQARARLEAILADGSAPWRSQAAMALSQLDIATADDTARATRLGELARGSDRQVSSWALDVLARSESSQAAAELASIDAQGGRLGRQARQHRSLLGVR